MKICIDARYVFPKIDGIGRYLINLIDKLSEVTLNNEKIHFYVLEVERFSSNSELRKFDGRKNITFIKITTLPQTIKNHFIGRYLRNLDLDIYHYPQFDLPWFVSGVKIVTSIMDMNPQKLHDFFPTKSGWFKRYYAILTNYIALKKSNKIITISESTKRELIDFYNFKDEHKIKAIYLGVDNKSSLKQNSNNINSELDEIKKKFKLDRYFLYVGNNRPHKNLDRVLQAFALVIQQVKIDIKFLIVGQQLKNNPEIEKYLVTLNLTDKVISTELSDTELTAVYSGAEAFIYCSLSEGFGLPVLEAMAQGTPVITSDLSSMKEISEGYALLVNPYSVESIKEGMLKLISDEELRKELSRKGLIRAREFTWEKCAQETIKIYSGLLTNSEYL